MSSSRSHSPLGEGQLTPEQQEKVNKASTSLNVEIRTDDDIAVTLLQAAKQNVNIKNLEIRASDDMCSEVVHAVADLLVTTPTIRSLAFDAASRYTGTIVNDDDHYATLTKAIAESDTLQDITFRMDLSEKLEQAVLGALKKKKSLTNLFLNCSTLTVRNPSNFSEVLATGNIHALHLFASQCDNWMFHDVLRRCQSLLYLYVNFNARSYVGNMASTISFLMESFRYNHSLRHLDLRSCFALGSSEALLLNELISEHETLSCLTISDRIFCEPDDFDALCDTVSHSRSINELNFDHSYSHHSEACNVSAVSRMLQQTTCLEIFTFPNIYDDEGEKLLAAGIRACKTLKTLFVDNYFSVETLIEIVMACPNITKVYWNKDEFGDTGAMVELDFYVMFNAQGASLVRNDTPDGLWPYVLAKAGRQSHQDALYYFLQETPQLVMQNARNANIDH